MKTLLFFIALWVLCSAAVFGQSDGPIFRFAVPEGACTMIADANAATGTITRVKAGDRVYLLTMYWDGPSRRMTLKVLVPDVLVLAVSRGASGGWIILGMKPKDTEAVLAAEKAHTLCMQMADKYSPPLGRPGDFWLPGEFQRLMEDDKPQRLQGSD